MFTNIICCGAALVDTNLSTQTSQSKFSVLCLQINYPVLKEA